MATAISLRNHEEPPVSPIQTDFSSPMTQRAARNDGDFGNMSPVSPIMSRRASHDSDRHSAGSGLTSQFPINPANVNPAPEYVAPQPASQAVIEHRASLNPPSSDSEEDGKRKDDIRFSKQALALVNAFLDQLLYSFLSAARSTSLAPLKSAVTEVLKHRLAKDAIAHADADLAEINNGDIEEDDDLDAQHRSQEEKRQWDLELVWKRTRLRVMVYSQLGEMEDGDEQRYVQEEELFYASERRFTSSTGLVSWSAALFLTSVLEYVGGQTLQIAGQAAHTRARRQSRTHRRSMSSDVMKPVDFMVEEHDVEKVALNPTLGRLWRTWRKSLRNNATAVPSSPATSRTSRERAFSGMGTHDEFTTPREGSVAGESRPMSRDQPDDIPEVEHPEYILAANIPLPMAGEARDIDEIVVEGLARDLDEEVDAVDFSNSPYPELMLALLVALPFIDEKRDVDEIEVPGLARDPDAQEEDDLWLLVSKDSMRRRSFSEYWPHRTIPKAFDAACPWPPSHTDTSFFTRPRAMSLPRQISAPVFMEDETAELPPSVDGAVEEAENGEQTKEREPAVDAVPGVAKKDPVEQAKEQEQGAEGVSRDVQAGAEQDRSEVPESVSETKDTSRWVAAGAAATGVAVAAGTIAVFAASDDNDETSESDASQGEGMKAPSTMPRALSENEKEVSPSPSDKEAEEIDKRKSLANIKDMMVVKGPTGDTSGQSSPETDSASNYSVASGSDEKEVLPSGEEALQNDKDESGIARGLDITDIVEAPDADAKGQQARGLDEQPGSLAMDDSRKQPEDGEVIREPTSTEPRQFLDLTDDEESTAEVPPVSAVTYADEPNAAPNGVTSNAKAESDNVQEHPVVPRLASLKGSEPSSASGSEKAVPMTSAAIRGPADFDMLVQNGETLKYTLTPDNVRDQPIEDGTRYVEGNSPVEMDATSTRARTPTSSSDNRTGRAVTSAGKTPTAEKRRSQSRPTPTNTASSAKNGYMAREPRVATESTRDFADFIRSTGPNKDDAVKPLLSNASQTSLHSLRSAHIRGASASRSSSPGADPNRGLRDDEDVPPVPRIPRRVKSGMEARGAKIVGNGSSDLIDFIRAGPKVDGEHRISRSVAPFRTTMDSDRFDGVDVGRNGDASLDPSLRTTSSLTAPSNGASANSRSALLTPSNGLSQAVQPPSTGAVTRGIDSLSAPNTSNGSAPTNGSSKKQYRNKDPYALDFDFDDENDDDFMLSTPRGGQEGESFLEFLRNHEPISNEPIRPLIDPNSAQARRIIANARSGNVPVDGRRTTPNSTAPRAVSQPQPGSRQAQISTTATAPNNKRKLEARSPGSKSRAGGGSLNTNDLAHFIRNSGPPDDPDTAPAPEVGRGSKMSENDRKKTEKKKRGSFFGLGGGKSQRYLDMP